MGLCACFSARAGTAGSGGERGQSAHSILQLELTSQQPPGTSTSGSGAGAGGASERGGERKLHLRMGREGMIDLLAKLDQIQTQIDKLS